MYEKIALDEKGIEKIHKKTLRAVIFSQILGGAGLAAGITVGALIAQQMLGTDKYSGVPSALFTLGSAAAAMLVGRLTMKTGRRIALSTGFFVGGVGALGIILATTLNNIWLLFLALFIYGSGTATNLQARYAGTDLAPVHKRATSVSLAMVSTTFGAVIGPNLVGVMGSLAKLVGIPELAGIFILAAAAFLSAGTVLFFYLKPDPYLLAKHLDTQRAKAHKDSTFEQQTSLNKSLVLVGATVMIITQLVMVAIMTMTPIHMQHHAQGMSAVGLVIGIHIASMYFPSLITGSLVNKVGTKWMAVASGVVLFLAALVTMLAPNGSTGWLMLGLSLLGIGWNFGLISGTTMVVDATSIQIRPKIQGWIDVFIAISGALGGFFSGIIMNYSSYSALSLMGLIISVLLVIVMSLSRTKELEIY